MIYLRKLLFLQFQFCILVLTKTENNTFIATKHWQAILEGQQVPAGLHFRINLQTGKKEAKLIEENSENSQNALSISESDDKNIDESKPNISTVSKNLEEALKHIPYDKLESSSPEKFDELKSKYKSYKEIKKDFEDMNMNIKSDFEILGNLIEQFVNVTKGSKNEQNILRILDDLNYLAHQIDNALWFIDKGGLDLVVLPGIVNQTNTDFRIKSLRILGALTQNNPRAQIKAFEKNFGSYLSQILITSTNSEELSTGIYAFGSLLRKFPHVQKEILSKSGTQALTAMLSRDIDLKVKIKALTLISDLLLEKEYALNMDVEASNKAKVEQYKDLLLDMWLNDAKFCEAVHDFFRASRHELLNKLDLVEYLVQSLRTIQSVCFKTWSKSSDFRQTLLKIRNSFQDADEEEYLREVLHEINQLYKQLFGNNKINDEL